ncbi:MAG: LacI family transcriptional regulator [Firmicutes bacterium]|nr:LacI family transcriptional regulator [Bacillota bacterium]
MANINDVAKIAGVSKSTVSYALSGKKYVSPEIKERVKKVCDEIDYTASFFASNILSNNTNIIGLFFEPENNRFHSFYNDLIETCMLELAKRKMYVIPYFGLTSSEIEKLLKTAAAPIMGAIIVTPKIIDNRMQLFGKEKLPFVLIGEPEKRPEKLFNVDIDNHELTQKIFNHAFDTGHRKILFLNSTKELMISKQRLNALESLNCKDLKITIRHIKSTKDSVFKVLEEDFKDDQFDCIVVSSSTKARYVYEFCNQKNIEIGKDISVITLGGDNFYGFSPALTGAKQDYFKIGKKAVGLLLKLIEGQPQNYGEQILIESDFIEGESVKK